jgi:putative SOS response-associated peptidase YedK
MCGRYIVVESVEVIEKRFHVDAKGVQLASNYNLSIGQIAPVITNEGKYRLQLFQFGLTPAWAKKQMYLFNARCEGDHNKEDDPRYTGGKGIIEKYAFSKPIRSKRCLVVADAFIEGPKDIGLSKPFVVYLQNHKRPFAMAGVWDTWKKPETGELIDSFAVITTTANELLQQIGHHRMPVILNEPDEVTWLNPSTELSQITKLLEPYPANLMNAYPVSPEIKSPKNNYKELLTPVGERLYPEYEFKFSQHVVMQGFGRPPLS